MTGKLKIKGQIMLAMKLDNVFKTIQLPSAKLQSTSIMNRDEYGHGIMYGT